MHSIRKKIMVLALMVSASGLVSRTAFAEEQPIATAQAGVALPLVGDLTDIADTGLYFGAQGLHRVDPHNAVGMNVGYYTFGGESENQVDTEVSIISMLALMHHDMGVPGSGTPFIETGFGFARTQVNIQTPTSGGAPILHGTNQEDISPTISLGVGYDMPTAYGATFGVSANYQHYFFKVGDVDGGGTLSVLAHLRI